MKRLKRIKTFKQLQRAKSEPIDEKIRLARLALVKADMELFNARCVLTSITPEEAEDLGDGTYRAALLAFSDEFNIDVEMNGIPIKGSPFRLSR